MKFSLLIPTYTGQEHIEKCFNSILNQQDIKKTKFEVVVVIDGPNKELATKVNIAKKEFNKNKINFKVHQFSKNKGRFDARLKAAELAKNEQLLFVDDRVVLNENLFKIISKMKDKYIMPNVLEASHPNAVSRLNYLLRRRIYGKGKWGENFKSFYIDKNNFEKSSKGTTSLWIPKNKFINVCENIKKQEGDAGNHYKNDDTKILKLIVDDDNRILRSSKLKIYYNPRSKLGDELKHLYKRGPTFVDYYFKPGTRYWKIFPLLLVFLLVFILLIILFGLKFLELTLGLGVIGILALCFYLAKKLSDILLVLITLPLVLATFSAGVVKGLFVKLIKN